MTTTEHETQQDSRGPNARYEMFSREGNDACEAEVAKIVAEVEAGKITRRTLREAYRRVLTAVAEAGHTEVHDTEPEWAIADEFTKRICRPQMWQDFSRWED